MRNVSCKLCVVLCVCVFVVFFFQAEDGIRDLVRSRGLGDVYKRQSLYSIEILSDSGSLAFICRKAVSESVTKNTCVTWAVSYTHLTLPTSDLV